MIPIPLNPLGVADKDDNKDYFIIQLHDAKQIGLDFSGNKSTHYKVYVDLGDGTTWRAQQSDSLAAVSSLRYTYSQYGDWQIKIKCQDLYSLIGNNGYVMNIISSNYNFQALDIQYGLIGVFYASAISTSLQQIAACAPQGGWKGIRSIQDLFQGCTDLTGSRSVFLAKFPDLQLYSSAFQDTNTTA